MKNEEWSPPCNINTGKEKSYYGPRELLCLMKATLMTETKCVSNALANAVAILVIASVGSRPASLAMPPTLKMDEHRLCFGEIYAFQEMGVTMMGIF